MQRQQNTEPPCPSRRHPSKKVSLPHQHRPWHCTRTGLPTCRREQGRLGIQVLGLGLGFRLNPLVVGFGLGLNPRAVCPVAHLGRHAGQWSAPTVGSQRRTHQKPCWPARAAAAPEPVPAHTSSSGLVMTDHGVGGCCQPCWHAQALCACSRPSPSRKAGLTH